MRLIVWIVMVVPLKTLHIQIPATGYVGLILRSTAVAFASRGTIEGNCERTPTLLWQKTEKLLRK